MAIVLGRNSKEITCTITEGKNTQTFRVPFAMGYDLGSARNAAIVAFRERFPAKTKHQKQTLKAAIHEFNKFLQLKGLGPYF